MHLDLDGVVAFAKRVLLQVGELRPLVIVQGQAGVARIPLEALPEDRKQKTKLLLRGGYSVGKDPRLGELIQVFVLFEGWMSRGAGRLPTVMPADDPQRQEVLSIAS